MAWRRWHQKNTRTIRVPESLAEAVTEMAHEIDELAADRGVSVEEAVLLYRRGERAGVSGSEMREVLEEMREVVRLLKEQVSAGKP